jgi:hypothetical protein
MKTCTRCKDTADFFYYRHDLIHGQRSIEVCTRCARALLTTIFELQPNSFEIARLCSIGEHQKAFELSISLTQ